MSERGPGWAGPESTMTAARILWVPGRPMAKQRPRLGGHGQFYSPDPTGYEERVAAEWVAAHGRTPLDGPVRVWLHFTFGRLRPGVVITVIPALPQKWGRPDVDNLAKSVLDALGPDNSGEARTLARRLGVKPPGVAWNDDSQVVELKVEKHRG